MSLSAILIMLGAVVCAGGGWLYFHRVQMTRPPIGVFDLSDVLFIFGFIILVPILYLIVPNWLAMGLLLLAEISLLYFVFEPLMKRMWVWLATIVLIGADLAAGFALGTADPVFMAINNIIVIFSAVSVANAWAQAGMKARDAAILGGLLIAYDFIATTHLSMMGDLVGRLSDLPLSPLLAWGHGSTYSALGLGDLIMLAVFPLTMRKGFGTRAGLAALGIGLAAIALLLISPIKGIFPVLIVLGPLMVIQYVWWRHRTPERRMKEALLSRNL